LFEGRDPSEEHALALAGQEAAPKKENGPVPLSNRPQ
jgi:hypothetical protein